MKAEVFKNRVEYLVHLSALGKINGLVLTGRQEIWELQIWEYACRPTSFIVVLNKEFINVASFIFSGLDWFISTAAFWMACFPAVWHKALICPGKAVTSCKNKGRSTREGVPMSCWRTQLLSAELTKGHSTLFFPAPVSSSLGWLLAVTESTLCFGCLCCYWHSQSAGRKRKEIAHQCNGGRLWWERRACLDCRTLTAGSRKEGSHCDVASKCTERIGTVLTRYCYTVNWLKKKPENQ